MSRTYKNQKTALVAGAGGFIGNHLVKRLVAEGFWVRGTDLRKPKYSKSEAQEFLVGDLRDPIFCNRIFDCAFDEVYQLAADMGGAGYVFTGLHDADVMSNSVLITINTLRSSVRAGVKKIFFSSSACVYPEFNQRDTKNPNCAEDSAYPAKPDSEYGWEKLFSERLYFAYHRNYQIDVRVARFHNIFGPEGSWNNGKEKSLAAICRKVAQAKDGGTIEIWGDGKQTRSYLYIDECLTGVRKLMDSTFTGPVNIGSDEMVSINDLARMVMTIAGKKLSIIHTDGPLGVRGRSSDNRLIQRTLHWSPRSRLIDGLKVTYKWIESQIRANRTDS